ncbi:hypothetical protein VTJ04DRAFT_6834 [Mycothermus thermophilus]|uniref:uncharacterized protein n=1 Tax=Humicola insolens TaxID=85995 RepID=UPI00374241EA
MSSPQAKWGTPDLPQIDRGRGAAAGLLARPTGRMGQSAKTLPLLGFPSLTCFPSLSFSPPVFVLCLPLFHTQLHHPFASCLASIDVFKTLAQSL